MRQLAFVFALLGLAAGAPAIATAQEAVTPDWAQQFMGSWDVQLETPDGVLPLTLTVRESSGTVELVLGNGQGEAPPITALTRDGDTLVAAYDTDYQGMPLPTILRIARDGDEIDTDWSFAEGLYATTAPGVKK